MSGDRSAEPNGAGQSSAVTDKAVAAVLDALSGGPLTRADLVRTLAQQLAGDADANAIISLVVRDDFHRGKPWKYDGERACLSHHEDQPLRRLSQEESVIRPDGSDLDDLEDEINDPPLDSILNELREIRDRLNNLILLVLVIGALALARLYHLL